MAFDFTESVCLQLPDSADYSFEDLSESNKKGKDKNLGLIVEIASIHEGMTANHNFYSANALADSVEAWVSPYPKPIIKNHDLSEEPLGRVMAAKVDYEEDGTAFIRLQAAITDESAIKKVGDKRYLTGSVGGKATSAKCSICSTDWATAESMSDLCKHKRGKKYDEKLAYLKIQGIEWKEYSVVNSPADEKSVILSMTESTDSSSLRESDNAKVFLVDLDAPRIIEHSSDGKTLDILESIQDQNQAQEIYENIKGAFISALNTTIEESNMPKDDVATSPDDDILAVSEELSSDLEVDAEESAETQESNSDNESDEETAAVQEGASDTDQVEEEASETVEDEDASLQEKEEEKEDQEVVQEEEVEEKETSEDETPDSEASDDVDQVEESDDNVQDSAVEDLQEKVSVLEAKVEQLVEENEKISNRSTKLENALKRSLAERVVDAKISLGLEEKSERNEMIEEHVTRSAASLADSLRDLSKMSVDSPQSDKPFIPSEMEDKSAAVKDETSRVVGEGDDDVETSFEEKVSSEEYQVDLFTDVLMGRKKL